MSNNARFGTGGCLGAKMTRKDKPVSNDVGGYVHPHRPLDMQHINEKGIAVYAILSTDAAASATVTVKASGTASVQAGGSYILMSSASASAETGGEGHWCRTTIGVFPP